MEFCPKCQKSVAIMEYLTGDSIDPLIGEEVRFNQYCSECHIFIGSVVGKFVNKHNGITRNGEL